MKRFNPDYSFFLVVSGLLLLISSFSSCNPDDDQPCNDPTNVYCPNYDPCLVFGPADASFKILDSIPSFAADTSFTLEIWDTTLTGNSVYFKANQIRDDATYTWKVGLDPRTFNESLFSLLFQGFEGTIEVSLIVEIEDELGCLSEAEKIDSSTQTLHFVDLPAEEWPIMGTFKGALESAPDESLNLTTYIFSTTSGIYQSELGGYDLDCPEDDDGFRVLGRYDYLVTPLLLNGLNFRCRNLTAIGRLHREDYDKITINFWYDADDGERVHDSFTGVRQ